MLKMTRSRAANKKVKKLGGKNNKVQVASKASDNNPESKDIKNVTSLLEYVTLHNKVDPNKHNTPNEIKQTNKFTVQKLCTLKSGTEQSICSLQFLYPSFIDVQDSQKDVFGSIYGLHFSKDVPMLDLPPPGFLNPSYYLATGSMNGLISIWCIKTKKLIQYFQAHRRDSPVVVIKNIKHNEFASIGAGESLKVWSIQTESEEYRLSLACKVELRLPNYDISMGSNYFQLFSQSGLLVAAFAEEKHLYSISVWSLYKEYKICELTLHEANRIGGVVKIEWIQKKNVVALLAGYTTASTGNVCVWRWANKDLYSNVMLSGELLNLEYDRKLNKGVICTNTHFYLFSVNVSFEINIQKEISRCTSIIRQCITRNDGRYFLVLDESKLCFHSWSSTQPLQYLKWSPGGSFTAMHHSYSNIGSIAPNEESTVMHHVLAIGSLDGDVNLYNVH